MTREEAIRILEDGSWWDLFPDEENDADMNPLNAAIDFAIAALREPQWISTKERLPEKSGVYLVCRKYRVSTVHYSAVHKKFNCYDNFTDNSVKMYAVDEDWWMPVPLGPKEDAQ